MLWARFTYLGSMCAFNVSCDATNIQRASPSRSGATHALAALHTLPRTIHKCPWKQAALATTKLIRETHAATRSSKRKPLHQHLER
jgi:hypothetical protein